MRDIASRLAAAGMSAAAAEQKSRLFAAAAEAIQAGDDARAWFVPGRIEVLGKHTDYAGGRSLLCTAERGMCVVAAPSAEPRLLVRDAVMQRDADLELTPLLKAADGWTNYLATTLRRVMRNFPGELRGARIGIASDLPRSAGMSSSSVLMIAVFLALAEVNQLRTRPEYLSNIRCDEDLAAYLACIENGQNFGTLQGDRGVGTFGGSEDHTAILCCRAGELSQYRFCPVALEDRIKMPERHIFAIASSGVAASKTGEAREHYNRASRSAGALLDIWNRTAHRLDPTLFAAVSLASAEKLRDVLRLSRDRDFSPSLLLDRFDQFYRESFRLIPAAAEALKKGDLDSFGKVVDESQRGAETGLHNQVPETSALARSARELGAVAASGFGAGFGGSVWAMVRHDQQDDFLHRWRAEYTRRFPGPASRSEFFATAAGPAVIHLD